MALGYREVSGIKLEYGLIRNHYVGRTFINPTQDHRIAKVKIKFNPGPRRDRGQVRRRRYHAIFMDCQIPVLDGYQATREIRRNEGAARHTPIVGVTASALSSARERSLAAGMDDHLTKPLTRESLATALSRWTAGGLTPVAAIEADEHRSTAAPATTLAGGAARVLDAEVIARLKRLGEDAGQDLLGELTTIFLADADIRMAELRICDRRRRRHNSRSPRTHAERSECQYRCDRPGKPVPRSGETGNGRRLDRRGNARGAGRGRGRTGTSCAPAEANAL